LECTLCLGRSQGLVGHDGPERTYRPGIAGRTGVGDSFYRTLNWRQWPLDETLCRRFWGQTVWVLRLILSVLADARMAWEKRRYRRGQPPGGDWMLWTAVVVLPVVLVLVLVGIWCGLRAAGGNS